MKRVIMCVCIGLLMLSGTVFASDAGSPDEVKILRNTVQDQNEVIQDLLRRLEAIEVQQEENTQLLESDSTKPLWAEKVKVKGDLRYRHEYIDAEDKDDRHRNRIRARLGVDAELHDSLDLHFQLSTGSCADCADGEGGDPVSGNQTLTGAFSGKNIWLTQAYFDWHPTNVEGLSILGGKIKYPFIVPQKSELIWDGDLNPEGGVVQYQRKFDNVELMANGYGFWLDEGSGPDDIYMLGAQGALKFKFDAFGEGAHAMAGVGYYDYENLKGTGALCEDDFFGNTDVEGMYVEDYDLISAFGEFGFKVQDMPVAIFGDYVTNDAANNSEDSGWSVGVKVGKTKDPNSWDVRYLYKVIEEDAVLGLFTDSDFGGGGTNSEGHEVNFGYQLTKSAKVGLSVFVNDVGIASGDDEKDYKRVQLDVEYKF